MVEIIQTGFFVIGIGVFLVFIVNFTRLVSEWVKDAKLDREIRRRRASSD